MFEFDFQDNEPGWLRPAMRYSVLKDIGLNSHLPRYEWRVGGLVPSSNENLFEKDCYYDWHVLSEIDQSRSEVIEIRYVLVASSKMSGDRSGKQCDDIEVHYRGNAKNYESAVDKVRQLALRKALMQLCPAMKGLASDVADKSILMDAIPCVSYKPSHYGTWAVGIDTTVVRGILLMQLSDQNTELPVTVSFDCNDPTPAAKQDAIAEAIRVAVEGKLSEYGAINVVCSDDVQVNSVSIEVGAPSISRGADPSRVPSEPPRNWIETSREIQMQIHLPSLEWIRMTRVVSGHEYRDGSIELTPHSLADGASKLLPEGDLLAFSVYCCTDQEN